MFFEKYRDEGFASSIDVAKSIALDMDVEPIFPTKHSVIRKKKQFDESNDDEVIHSIHELFRVNYFLIVVDMSITSIKNIFEQLKTFESIFGFLFDSNKLKSLDDDELRKRCVNFHLSFTHENLSDVNQMIFFLN